MTLSYYCKSCSQKNYIKSKTKNRYDLQREMGDEVKRNCDRCGTYGVTHINRLYAEPNKMALVWALLLAIVLTGVVFWLGWIASVTFVVPIWFYFDQQKTATEYNKVKVPRN